MSKENLIEKIQKTDAKITVIGLGQVGLPVSLSFSQINFKVFGFDINKTLTKSLIAGKIPYNEHNLEDLMSSCVNNKCFSVSENLSDTIKISDVIILCVATPVSDQNIPNLSALESACKSISELSLENKLIIVESSIPPGTFENIIMPYFEKNYSLGSDFYVAYVPERLSPGQAFEDIKNTSRIIGGIDENSSQLAYELYKKIVKNELHKTNVRIAEISKLVENTFRDVNVAFANEVGLICEKYRVDAFELIKISNSHPRVNILTPGPGVGGPCLPKDPYLLLNPINEESISSKIITESRKINNSMPLHVVEVIIDSLERKQKIIKNSKILIMGIAYKANISDIRNSPSKEIISNLLNKGANVFVHDPKTKENFGATTISNFSSTTIDFDVIVFITDHDEFKQITLSEIYSHMSTNPILVDTRRIFNNHEAEKLGFYYTSIGYTLH